jgi:hypothetical protein
MNQTILILGALFVVLIWIAGLIFWSKLRSFLFKLPLIILNLILLGGTFYIGFTNYDNYGWNSFITVLILDVLYMAGILIKNKKEKQNGEILTNTSN